MQFLQKITTSLFAMPWTALTFNATMVVDCSKGSRFKFTATANFSLSFTNVQNGQSILLEITQDGSGSRTISSWGASGASVYFSTDVPSTAITLSSAPGSIDMISCVGTSASNIRVLGIEHSFGG